MKETTAIDVRDEQRRLKLIKFGQLAIAWKQAWRRKISQEAIVLQNLTSVSKKLGQSALVKCVTLKKIPTVVL